MDPDAIEKLGTSDNEQQDTEKGNQNWLTRRRQHAALLPVDSWNWWLMPMTTLGFSTLVHAQTTIKDFGGLYAWGLTIYFIGLVEYFFVLFMKTNKALLNHRTLLTSMAQPSEAMFFATFWISTYGLITGAIDYASVDPGSNLSLTFFGLFWIYFIFALTSGIGIHILLSHEHLLHGKDMTPAWLLPLLPFILTGVMAGNLAPSLTQAKAFPVLICGLLMSSMGFLLSLPIAGIYLWRLFTAGLPEPNHRPAMMIAVGPPSYAPLAYLKLAAAVPIGYGVFAEIPFAATICQVLALVFGVAIIGMALFFFLMAFFAIVGRANQMSFHMTWYGFIFPNVGLLSTVGILGLQIPSEGVQWVVSVFTAALFVVWLFVSGMHIRAIVAKQDAF